MASEMEEREMDEIIDKQMAKDLEMAARKIDEETEELKAREEEDRIREHEREKEDQIRELECTVKQLLAALDSPDSASAAIFKENLKICFMRHTDHKDSVELLCQYLHTSGYTKVTVFSGTELPSGNYGDFEVWILLPPNILPDDNSRNNSREYSNHVGSLECNLRNYRSSPNPKVIIHSNLNQSESCTRERECKRILKSQEKYKKWMVKDIPALNEESVGASLGEVLLFMVQKKFTEIVDISYIVVTVGIESVPDFRSLWKQFVKDFKPHSSYKFPPKKVSFTKEEGQKLKNANVTWTLGVSLIENEVAEFLKRGKPFVFYRNGSFSGVNENIEMALDAAFNKVGKNHYFLVVGDDSGIEEEILEDIKMVAYLADLSDEQFANIDQELQQCDDPCGLKIRLISTENIFTLLVLPDVDQLKENLKEELQCPYFTFTVIYSGHGSPDGSWCLYGDSFSASDFKEILHSIPKPQLHIKLRVYLNCCYGLAFAKQVSNTQLLHAAFELNFQDMQESEKYPAQLKDRTMEEIINYAENPCSDDDTESHKSLNSCITEQMIRVWKLVIDFMSLNDVNFNGFIVPFAFGPLDAKGVLLKLIKNEKNYQLSVTTTLSDTSRVIPVKMDCRLYGIDVDSEPADPQLIVFPGAHGDSTLFRWHNFNMLVDGGWINTTSRRCGKSPCFWETIRRLPENQKLDIVVVTHYDEDHIAGILRLFEERDSLPIGVEKLYTVQPPSNGQPTTRSAKQGNDLWERGRSSSKCMKVLNLNTDCKRPIFSKELSDTGDHLCIFMVTPTEANLLKACQDMRALSPANIGSASLLIKCFIQSANDHRYALLTGDAPPQAIINGLNTLKASNLLDENAHQDNHYSFDYVDMPHHGAYKENPDRLDNNPQLFLSRIHTKACVVSTNGKMKYRHPHDRTLEFLKESFKSTTITRLFFTYNRRNEEDIRPKFAEQLGNCVFANNNPSDKNPTRCFLFNLRTHQYGECETNQVTKAHCTHSYM